MPFTQPQFHLPRSHNSASGPVLSQSNPVHIFPTLHSWMLVLFLYFKWSLTSRFYEDTFFINFVFPVSYMSKPSHSTWFGQRRRYTLWSLLFCNFLYDILPLLDTDISLGALFLIESNIKHGTFRFWTEMDSTAVQYVHCRLPASQTRSRQNSEFQVVIPYVNDYLKTAQFTSSLC